MRLPPPADRKPTSLDFAAAAVARVVPRAWRRGLDQARRDATTVGRTLGGEPPVPATDAARAIERAPDLDGIDLLDALPRLLREPLKAARRDVRMLTGQLLRGEKPSPTIARSRSQVPTRAELVPLHATSVKPRPIRVTRVVKETDDAISLHLAEVDGRPLRFEAGQFLTFEVVVDGERLRRAYSLANAAIEGEPPHVTVKRVPGGKVSNFLHDHVRAGDVLHVLGPSGAFVATAAAGPRHLVFLAGGSGITPIASLLETVLRTEPPAHATLVYGNRGPGAVIFRERLDALRAAHTDRLAIDHVLEEGAPFATTGRLDADTVGARLDALGVTDAPATIYFVCGPTPMMEAARAALIARGVEPTRIREERFSSAEARHAREGSRMPQEVRLRQKGGTAVAIATPGQSVLDAGLAAGVSMPFSCAMGGCGACKVHLVEGQIEMDEPNCLTEQERAGGYVLTCVGHAMSRVTLELPETEGRRGRA